MGVGTKIAGYDLGLSVTISTQLFLIGTVLSPSVPKFLGALVDQQQHTLSSTSYYVTWTYMQLVVIDLALDPWCALNPDAIASLFVLPPHCLLVHLVSSTCIVFVILSKRRKIPDGVYQTRRRKKKHQETEERQMSGRPGDIIRPKKLEGKKKMKP